MTQDNQQRAMDSLFMDFMKEARGYRKEDVEFQTNTILSLERLDKRMEKIETKHQEEKDRGKFWGQELVKHLLTMVCSVALMYFFIAIGWKSPGHSSLKMKENISLFKLQRNHSLANKSRGGRDYE